MSLEALYTLPWSEIDLAFRVYRSNEKAAKEARIEARREGRRKK